jgi:hypothetical protein
MREFLERIARIFGWMDAVEFAIPAILAALVLVVGPLLTTFYFFHTHHILAAAISFGIWIMAAVACIRDFHRRHFGWVSVTLGVVWFVTTLIVWWRLGTA